MYYEIGSNLLPKIRLAGRATVQSPYVYPQMNSKEFILYLITKGRMYIQGQSEKLVVSEGEVLLLEAKDIVFEAGSCDCEYAYVLFEQEQIRVRDTEDLAKLYEETNILLPRDISLIHQKVFQRVVKLMGEVIECKKAHSQMDEVVCACRLMEIFVELGKAEALKETSPKPKKVSYAYQRVQQLSQYLNTNYAKNISGQKIEEEFACNFDYLNRIFKKYTGKTIFVYLNEIRIQYAKEMLETTSMKVAAVGYLVGYKDEGYFNKVFKKYTGTSPGQYEKVAVDESKLESTLVI